MALGRNHRMESRRPPSSNCSTVTLVVFVGLCLVGIWMMTSSSVDPVNLSTSEPQSDVKSQVKSFNDGAGQQFEGGNGDDGSSKDRNSETSNDREEAPPERTDDTNKASTDSPPTQADDDTDANEGQYPNEETNREVSAKKDSPENANNEHVDQEKPKEEFVRDNPEGEDTEVEKIYSKAEDQRDVQSGKQNSTAIIPDDTQLEILNETNTQNGPWSTQDTESTTEKKSQETLSKNFIWKLCIVNAGSDYIPCLDNEEAIKKLRTTKHYEHRERHCPGESPTCLVPLPDGYRQPIKWPVSRDKIWYYNVPHTKLAEVKGHQNWVKVSGEYLTFPGGGTQFQHGALHYIDFIQEILPEISWGKQSRVVLDVGCGVASFGGYLFDRDVLTMSFAPKDEHEAQVQFALERGIPAISAVMGTKRLPFPSIIFDVVHCARCRVPWHIEDGKLLLELNRLLRPGGFFVWSATPVYQKLAEDLEIWNAMSELTKSMCWELLTVEKDTVNGVGVAIYRKPSSNECYEAREKNDPPLCQESDDSDAAWNVSLQACMHRAPANPLERGSKWPELWPQRLQIPPYWLNNSLTGVYGKPAPEDFLSDYQHWKRSITSYLKFSGIDWSRVRNVMDMRSIYGGFAAALRDLKIWVMNVVPIDSPDTLPIIYERGLFGMYHDWCESFSTYPRSYDLLHADHLFSKLKKRCKLLPLVVEVDRVLRPGGYLIMRDTKEAIEEVEQIGKSLHYETQIVYLKKKEGLLLIKKSLWRPARSEVNSSEPSSTSRKL